MNQRPYCICHMISTIDGRLLVDQWTPHVDGDAARLVADIYEAVGSRLEGDAFLIGRTTMAEFDGVDEGEATSGGTPSRPLYRAPAASGMWAIVIDSKGKLRYANGDIDGSPIVCVLGEAVSDDYLAGLRAKGISYIFAGRDGRDLATALRQLREVFRIERLLLEGGGATNGTFFEAGLVDEVSLIVYPGVDGHAGSPTVVDANVPCERPIHPEMRLRHAATETLEHGFVWLRYAVDAGDQAHC